MVYCNYFLFFFVQNSKFKHYIVYTLWAYAVVRFSEINEQGPPSHILPILGIDPFSNLPYNRQLLSYRVDFPILNPQPIKVYFTQY